MPFFVFVPRGQPRGGVDGAEEHHGRSSVVTIDTAALRDGSSSEGINAAASSSFSLAAGAVGSVAVAPVAPKLSAEEPKKSLPLPEHPFLSESSSPSRAGSLSNSPFLRSSPTCSASSAPPPLALYEELAGDSLKAAAVENGLQTNAIYWETGHRTYLPFWSSLRQKFNSKIIDDAARRFFGLVEEESSEPYVFYGSQPILRHYNGDPSLYTTAPLQQPPRFVLSPTGTAPATAVAAVPPARGQRCEGVDVFAAVVKSAFEVDFSHLLSRELPSTAGI